jgi:hypothetical protein
MDGRIVAQCTSMPVMLLLSVLLTQAPAPRLESVSWLEGCWRDASPKRTVDETWSAPRGGVMRGTGRTTRDGRVVDSEHVVLRADGEGLVYEAHPSGQPSAEFRSITIGERAIVFENPEHDFPQRIGYQRQEGDGLLAWIEGPVKGETKRIEFRYRRVACDTK